MSDLLTEFESDCAAAGVKPTAILKAANIHPSLWWKWRAGQVSPTLRNFEAAREELRQRGSAVDGGSPQGHGGNVADGVSDVSRNPKGQIGGAR